MLTAVAAALSGGSQPVLPGFLNSLAGPLAHYGLWAIALLVLVEDFGIPVPGETVLIAGAIYAGSGRLNVIAVGVVGFVAAVVGDNIGYAIGRFGGRALVERWGKYVFITPERLDKAEAFFENHGGKIITIARFIEGLRQANGLIAGITHMHWLKFVAFNALGAALWVGTWVSVGYFAGQHISTIYTDITNYSLYAAIAAVVLIAAWVFFRLRRRRRERAAPATMRAADSEAAAGEAAAGGKAAAGQAQDAEPGAAAQPHGQVQADIAAGQANRAAAGSPDPESRDAGRAAETAGEGEAATGESGQAAPRPASGAPTPLSNGARPHRDSQPGPGDRQAEARAQDSDRS